MSDVRITDARIAGREVIVISLPIMPQAAALEELTNAERQVVGLVLEGLSNREAAARRGVSERTIANQVAALFRKLGVRSRSELAALIGGPREHS